MLLTAAAGILSEWQNQPKGSVHHGAFLHGGELQESTRLLRESPLMIPCIPGVTQLQEVGRTPQIVGYHGKQDSRDVIVELFRETSLDEAWFFRSAALQSRLGQAAIPTFIEVGRIEGRPYRLREYVQGRPAQQLLSDGPLAEERLVALTRGVAAALKALHQRGFVHGCLTLDHLRVDRSGVFRLLDAGACEPIGSPWYAASSGYPIVSSSSLPIACLVPDGSGDPIAWSDDHYHSPESAMGHPLSPRPTYTVWELQGL